MRRFIALLQVVSLAALAAACSSSSGSASSTAATGTVPTVICTAISGLNDVGQKLALSGCTGPAGDSGTVMGPFASPTVIHWASGGVTQLIFDENVTMTSDPACPKQMTVIGGKVLSSTVAGISGDFHAAFCIGTNLAITLAPRTTLSL